MTGRCPITGGVPGWEIIGWYKVFDDGKCPRRRDVLLCEVSAYVGSPLVNVRGGK